MLRSTRELSCRLYYALATASNTFEAGLSPMQGKTCRTPDEPTEEDPGLKRRSESPSIRSDITGTGGGG